MSSQRDPYIIGGQSVGLGESKVIRVKFSEAYLGDALTMPVHVIRAKEPGPCLLLTGAIHGDELTGIGIIRELLYDKPPQLTRGALICVPVVNVLGLENHSRYLPDRRDLNRSFPGAAQGSMATRLAHTLITDILKYADYCIDFHSAAVRRTNYPNVRANMRISQVKELAQAFGCELIVNGTGPDKSFRKVAVAKGVPTIILEAGEVWKTEQPIVEVGVRGCWNVLRHFNMIDGEPEKPQFQAVIEKTKWVRSQRGGFLGFHIRPGEFVKNEQELATVYSVFGKERHTLTSPGNGVVLGVTTMPAVKPGDAVYHIALLNSKVFKQAQKRIDLQDEGDYERIQSVLSSSITIEGELPQAK